MVGGLHRKIGLPEPRRPVPLPKEWFKEAGYDHAFPKKTRIAKYANGPKKQVVEEKSTMNHTHRAKNRRRPTTWKDMRRSAEQTKTSSTYTKFPHLASTIPSSRRRLSVRWSMIQLLLSNHLQVLAFFNAHRQT